MIQNRPFDLCFKLNLWSIQLYKESLPYLEEFMCHTTLPLQDKFKANALKIVHGKI